MKHSTKLALAAASAGQAVAQVSPLPALTLRAEARDGRASVDAVVEAVRQSVVSAQVAGAIVSLSVKAGDTVRAGQPLLRIEAQAATENVAASLAQVNAAQSQLDVAAREYERQKQLFARQFISQAALDRAQGQWQVAQAQLDALQAQAKAARAQSGFFVINAPYTAAAATHDLAITASSGTGNGLQVWHDQFTFPTGSSVLLTNITTTGQNVMTQIGRAHV